MPERTAELRQAGDPLEFGLPIETVTKLRHLFAQFSGIEYVWIYGSRAKGNCRPASDIDLSLEAPAMKSVQLLDLVQRIDDLLLPYQVDLSLLHQIENLSLREHIARVGLVFWKKS
jgi:predicted nucleotidyltransferase